MVRIRFLGRGNDRTRCNALAATGALLLTLSGLLGTLGERVQAQTGDKGNRFQFNIEPKTPLKDMLPAAPDATAVTLPWLVKDLAQVPQVVFQKPDALVNKPLSRPKTNAEKQEAMTRELEDQNRANEKTAHLTARINHLNLKGTDHFVKVLRENRDDLAGLPFIMGDACRLSGQRSAAFVKGVSMVRDSMAPEPQEKAPPVVRATEATKFWIGYTLRHIWAKDRDAPEPAGARIAALMQVLAPEDKALRQKLVHHLSGIDHAEATRALARLAIFSVEDEVRQPAVASLKTRPKDAYTDLLLEGLRYPWRAVTKNAADAIIQLGRKDMVPQLVSVLDEPDPRAPVETMVAGKKTTTVRELVRLNHNRSCLLCHPPANTPDMVLSDGTPADILTAPVPSPGLPFRSPSRGYDQFNMPPEIFVLTDVTYLRQDFSLLQPVKDADPVLEMQRFDFLVRTRPVTAAEVAAYQDWLRQQGPGYLAPHQHAAITALRALTGRDAPEPTTKAWRLVLAQSFVLPK